MAGAIVPLLPIANDLEPTERRAAGRPIDLVAGRQLARGSCVEPSSPAGLLIVGLWLLLFRLFGALRRGPSQVAASNDCEWFAHLRFRGLPPTPVRGWCHRSAPVRRQMIWDI